MEHTKKRNKLDELWSIVFSLTQFMVVYLSSNFPLGSFHELLIEIPLCFIGSFGTMKSTIHFYNCAVSASLFLAEFFFIIIILELEFIKTVMQM